MLEHFFPQLVTSSHYSQLWLCLAVTVVFNKKRKNVEVENKLEESYKRLVIV